MLPRARAAWLQALLIKPSTEGVHDKRFNSGDKRQNWAVEHGTLTPIIRELCTPHTTYLPVVTVEEASRLSS